MESSTYIQSYCRIRNHQIIQDGVKLFTNVEDLHPSYWLKSIYKSMEMEYPKFHKMDLLSKATLLACELIHRKYPLKDNGMPLVFSNRGSSYVSDQKHASAIYSEEGAASPAVFVYTLPNIALGEVCIRYGLHAENNFFIFDKFTPEFLADYHGIFIDDPKVDQLLGGWVEVEEDQLDILIYLIGKSGNAVHTQETLTTLYYID